MGLLVSHAGPNREGDRDSHRVKRTRGQLPLALIKLQVLAANVVGGARVVDEDVLLVGGSLQAFHKIVGIDRVALVSGKHRRQALLLFPAAFQPFAPNRQIGAFRPIQQGRHEGPQVLLDLQDRVQSGFGELGPIQIDHGDFDIIGEGLVMPTGKGMGHAAAQAENNIAVFHDPFCRAAAADAAQTEKVGLPVGQDVEGHPGANDGGVEPFGQLLEFGNHPGGPDALAKHDHRALGRLEQLQRGRHLAAAILGLLRVLSFVALQRLRVDLGRLHVHRDIQPDRSSPPRHRHLDRRLQMFADRRWIVDADSVFGDVFHISDDVEPLNTERADIVKNLVARNLAR